MHKHPRRSVTFKPRPRHAEPIVVDVKNPNIPDSRQGVPKRIYKKISSIANNLRKNSKTWSRKRLLTFAGVSFLLLATVISLGVYIANREDPYLLTAASSNLIGEPNKTLSTKLSHDAKKRQFIYNKESISQGSPDSPQAALAAAQKGQKVGGGADNYAVDLNVDSHKGLTVHDVTDSSGSLAISLIPQFKTREGKLVDGRVIYPLKGHNGSLVYTVKANGLKEDIVLDKEQGNELSFSYQLKLPKALEARLQTDGSIGVYSADTALFGNISFGSDQDRDKVEKARTSGQKNHLVFVIPAPVTTQTGQANDQVKASFELKGDQLTIKASNLSQASYPISIDPSVAVTSATDFAKGNFEGGIEIDSSNNQIKRAGLTGGTVQTWASTSSLIINEGADSFSFAYNGYLYSVAANGTEYALLCTGSNSGVGGCGATAGTVGTWATTGDASLGRHSAGISFYNGYVYVVGGCGAGAAGACTSMLSDTKYAKINADGTIGAWANAGGAFTSARDNPASVTYNGYLYLAGGCGANNGFGACTGWASDVQYAKINADGTIGAWANGGNNFTTGRYGLAMATYNGYLYIMEGCSGDDSFSGACNSSPNDAQYAAIKADGTIGSWTATNAPGGAYSVGRNSVAVYNGYIYGGASGSSATIYSRINADGTLDTWRATNTFTTNLSGFSFAAANGFLYKVSGYDNSNNELTDVQYAKINTAGATGNYVASSNLYTAPSGSNLTFDANVVAYNGYLYVIGGCSVPGGIGNFNGSNTCNGANVLNQVLYAPINADGSLGTFLKSSSNLAFARYGGSVVAYNNRLYLVGGAASSSVSNDVQYSSVISSGNPGAWTQATSEFTGSRYMHATAVFNSRIYVIGGCNNINSCNAANGADYNDVWSIPINSDGTVSNSSGTSLGTFDTNGRQKLAATYYGGYLYISGGWHGSTFNADVRYIKVNSDGSFTGNSWQDGGHNFSTARGNHGMFINNGYLYIVGGCSTVDVNQQCTGGIRGDTQYAPLDLSTGAVGAWNTVAMPSLNTSRFAAGTAAYNGNVYVASGCTSADCASISNNVEIAPINNGGPGMSGSWATSGNNLVSTRQAPAAVAYNGYLYSLGGSGTDTSNAVQYANIYTDGSIGTWTSTSSFAIPSGARKYPYAAAYNGYMYVIGGIGTALYGDVQFAQINNNGTLGAWNYTDNSQNRGNSFNAGLNQGRWGHGGTIYNGYIYVLGGCVNYDFITQSCTAPNQTNTIEYAQINATNGTIGAWNYTSNSFTTARLSLTATAFNGYIYIAGGCSGFTTGGCTNNSTYLGDVQYALICTGANNGVGGCNSSAGNVGTWNSLNTLPAPRYTHSMSILNGYMYLVGGIGTGGSQLTDVTFAPININGTIGPWSPAGSLSANRYIHGSAVYNGRIYLVGGRSGNSDVATTTYAGLQSIPRKGSYSWMSDLAGDAVATKLLLRGSVTSGSQLTFGLRDALNSNKSFGSTTTYQSLTPGSLFDIPATEKQYRQLVFSLDDSQSASFPDSLGVSSTISDFELYFHAASGKRLRGGKTFTGETQRSLDAQPQ